MDDMYDTPGATSRSMASVLAETILEDIVAGMMSPGSKLRSENWRTAIKRA